MTADQTQSQRLLFEKWISAPPYEQDIERFPESSAWPGHYQTYEVQLAWEAWRESIKQKL